MEGRIVALRNIYSNRVLKGKQKLHYLCGHRVDQGYYKCRRYKNFLNLWIISVEVFRPVHKLPIVVDAITTDKIHATVIPLGNKVIPRPVTISGGHRFLSALYRVARWYGSCSFIVLFFIRDYLFKSSCPAPNQRLSLRPVGSIWSAKPLVNHWLNAILHR